MRYQNQPLTDEQIRQYAPSAFAIQPWEKMSEKYAFVPTSNIIAGMRSAGFQPFQAMQSRSRIAGKDQFTKHVIRFRSDRSNLAVGDNFFETVLTNSMDGTSAYVLDSGVFRLTCLNGAYVSDGTLESVHIIHKGNIIEQVVDSASRLIEQAPKVIEAISQWKAIELSRPEQHLLAESAQSLRYDDLTQAPNTEQLLQARRPEDNRNDLWTVFNRIQENTVRGGIIPRDSDGSLRYVANGERVNRFSEGARRVSRTREIKDLGFNSKVNKALWSLAEKFAQLKQG